MRIPLFPALFLLLLASPATSAEPQSLRGEVVVRSIGDNRIAVLVDTNGDDAIDQGFLLSSDLPVSSTTARGRDATVLHTPSYVRVVFEKEVYDLYVAGYPEPPAAPQDHETTRFIGYVLLRSSGDSGCSMERAMKDAGACYAYEKE